jgi:hypothetical protein
MPPKEGSKAPAKAPAKKTTEKKKKKVSKAETYKIYIYKCVRDRSGAGRARGFVAIRSQGRSRLHDGLQWSCLCIDS